LWTQPPWTQPRYQGIIYKGKFEYMNIMSNPNENNDNEEAQVAAAAAKATADELAKIKGENANLIDEMKELRTTKNEEIEALKLAKPPVDKNGEGEGDIQSQITKALQERDSLSLKETKEKTIANFRESQSEFSSDNDPGNLKFATFEKELKKFNLDDLKSEGEIKSRLKEVYDFANREKTSEDNSNNQYASTSREGGTAPAISGAQLSEKERKLIKIHNFEEERYLKMKEKRPHYVNNLLKFID